MGTMTLRPLPLDPELALGTIAECLANSLAAGSFDDFSYCAADPGVKIWFASTGHNHRREPERIWVLRGGS